MEVKDKISTLANLLRCLFPLARDNNSNNSNNNRKSLVTKKKFKNNEELWQQKNKIGNLTKITKINDLWHRKFQGMEMEMGRILDSLVHLMTTTTSWEKKNLERKYKKVHMDLFSGKMIKRRDNRKSKLNSRNTGWILIMTVMVMTTRMMRKKKIIMKRLLGKNSENISNKSTRSTQTQITLIHNELVIRVTTL